MSAELEEMQQNLEQEESTEEVVNEIEYSETQQEAMSKGWKPEGVEGKPNLSAEEFLRNESFLKEIHKLKREMGKQTKVIDALKEHNKQTSQKAYDKAVKELKEAKKAAADEEDVKRVVELDDQLEELQEAKRKADQAEAEAVTQDGFSEEDFRDAFQSWTDKNIWYGRRGDMTADAEALYDQYSRKNPVSSPEDRFSYVDKEMRKAYPEHFENPNRQKAAVVSTQTRSGKNGGAKMKHTLSEIDEADRAIANTLIRNGVMTEEEYLKDYFQE